MPILEGERSSDPDVEIDGGGAPRLDQPIPVRHDLAASRIADRRGRRRCASGNPARTTTPQDFERDGIHDGKREKGWCRSYVTVRTIATTCGALLFGAATAIVKACCPGASAGAAAPFTVIDRAPVALFTTKPTRAADGVHAMVPRFANVPAPVFVNVTNTGPAVPPAVTVGLRTVALSEKHRLQDAEADVTFCGLSNAPVADTGTWTSVGLAVSSAGFSVR